MPVIYFEVMNYIFFVCMSLSMRESRQKRTNLPGISFSSTALFSGAFLPSCGLIWNCMACCPVGDVHAKRSMAASVNKEQRHCCSFRLSSSVLCWTPFLLL